VSESAISILKSFFSGISKILSVLGKVAKAFVVVLLALGVIAWIGIISTWTSGTSIDIPDSGALRVELNGFLVDELSYTDPLNGLISDNQPSEHLLRNVIDSINAASEDDRINSMVLVLHDFSGGGSSKVLELGEAIQNFQTAGKPVYAVADLFTQQVYLLASFADEIYINPLGGVELKGLGSYRSYYGEAFDKLKVNFHVFRTGEFKDAVEPYTENEMSEASASQTLNWLEDIWQVYRKTISSNRDINPDTIDRYANEFDQLMLESQGNAALVAQENGLVDGLYFRDQILGRLIDQIGINEDQDFYPHSDYLPYLYQVEPDSSDDSPVIGLVVAAGTILDGSQTAGSIGGDSLAAKLRQMRDTKDLAALVLRVDSPGGSAFASDIIRRELALFEEEGVPLIISMGSLAASGGYWISMPADEIWATPTTLTGSIGVFGIVPTVDETLGNIGIRRDGVGTGPLASSFILDLPMSDQVAQIIQSSVDHIYDEFLALVANSRGISVADLDALAQGRVWTGSQALDLGLVDKLGSLQHALDSAALIAGVSDDYQIYEVSPELSLMEQLTKFIVDSVSISIPVQNQSNLASVLGSYWANFQSNTAELAILMNDPGHKYLFCASCEVSDLSTQP
jgi:protease-4